MEIAFRGAGRQAPGVTKFCILLGSTAVSFLFSFLVSPWGMMAEIIAGAVGSLVGVWVGWKVAQKIDQV